MKKGRLTVLILIVSVVLILIYSYLVESYYNDHNYNLTLDCNNEQYTATVDATLQIPITIHNKSRRIISSDNGFFLSYHLFHSDGTLIQFENSRSGIAPINPYGDGINLLNILVPETPGNYIVEVDIVEEGFVWFGDMGNETKRIQMTVS